MAAADEATGCASGETQAYGLAAVKTRFVIGAVMAVRQLVQLPDSQRAWRRLRRSRAGERRSVGGRSGATAA